MRVEDLFSGSTQESDFEKIVGIGEWWLPTHDEICVAGEFSFNINTGGCLIATGNFGEEQDQEFNDLNFPVICGRTDAGGEVTLFDCKVINMRSYKGSDSHNRVERDIVPGECWLGNVSYKSKNELLFEEVIFGINNLNWWVADSIFAYNINDHELNKISFRADNKVVIHEDDFIYIAIMHQPEIHSTNPGELKLGIEDHLRVIIHSKIGPIPYYATPRTIFLSDYVDKVYSFLSLLIGENPYIYDVRGRCGPNKVHLRVMRDITERNRHGGMDSLRVLFPRQILFCVDIQSVFSRFMSTYDKAQAGVRYLVGFNIRSQLYEQHTLPEAIYNFEGIESVLYDDYITTAEYSLSHANKAILDGIMAKCEAREKNFLETRFKRKAITLKERFCRVLNDMYEIFPYINGIEDRVLKSLVKVRNNYSHYGQGDFTDPYLYVALVHFVNYVTVSLVLYKSGMPTKAIAACLNKVEGDYLGIKYNFERCFPVATEKEKHKK